MESNEGDMSATKPTVVAGKKATLKSTAKGPSRGYKPRSSGTVWIDGIKVKILPPVGQGTISTAKIRQAILAVQQAKLKADS